MERIFLLGANNPEIGRMIRATLLKRPVEFIGFIDNDKEKWGSTFCGLRVLGGYAALSSIDKNCGFVNLITRDAVTRYETTRAVQSSGFKLSTLIHPNIDLTSTDVAKGAYLQEAVVLQAGVKLGENVSIHMGSLIGHESTVGAHTFIAHGVTISGLVNIGKGCFVGAGSTFVPRISIGEGSVVGAGAVVTKSVPPWSVVVGNPARIIRTMEKTTFD